MRRKIIILALIICVLTACLSGCSINNLEQVDLGIGYFQAYGILGDRTVEIFVSGNEMLNYFNNIEAYKTLNFDNKLVELNDSGFFEKYSILFVSLTGSSDMDLNVKKVKSQNKLTLKFRIDLGMLEDIGERFYFFKIEKSLLNECSEINYKFTTVSNH